MQLTLSLIKYAFFSLLLLSIRAIVEKKWKISSILRIRNGKSFKKKTWRSWAFKQFIFCSTGLLKSLEDLSYLMRTAFHESLCKLTVKPYFAIVFFNTYAICACGISFLSSDYYSAISLAVSSILQLVIVFGIGTSICHQRKRLLDVLCEFDWYRLDLADQKDFLAF